MEHVHDGQSDAQSSDFAYVISPEYDAKGEIIHVELLRPNTVTGRSYREDAPPRVMRWVLDQHGEPAVVISAERDEGIVYYRARSTKVWRKVSSYKLYDGAGGYSPLAFGPDGTLYVAASAGKDKQSVSRVPVPRTLAST